MKSKKDILRLYGRSAVIALLLTAILLPVLPGCGKTPGGTEGSDTEAPAPEVLLDLSQAEELYVIRPDNASQSIIQAMKDTSALLKTVSSAKIVCADDWYKNEEDIDRFEILIGKVDRPEVIEEFSGLRANDYIVRFSEKKLWITGGTDEATLKAFDEFIGMLKGMTSLSFEAAGGVLARFTDNYEINETLLIGKPFRDYKLVYSSANYNQSGAVAAFRNDVMASSGYVLGTSTNLHTQAECKIQLKSVYEDGTSVPLYDYSIESTGTAITVYGGSNKAFRKALDLIYAGFADGTLKEETATISEKGSFSFLTDEYHDVLKGLKLYAIGDSYFAGPGLESTQVWPALLAEKYGMKFLNYGIGGSTISNYTTEHNPMVDRINKMSRVSPDIVLFEGSRNDFNNLTPLGDKDSRDSKTLRGAVRLCIEKLHDMYPNALIICITNWNYPGTHGIADCYGYASAFKETANEYEYAVCINATNTNIIPIDASDAKFRTEFFNETTDVSHLNAKGMRYVEPYFEELIAYYYSAFTQGELAATK